MNADGSGLTNLTNNRNWDFQPAWSPYGACIAFTTFRGDPPGNYEIFVMNADCSGQTNLTNNVATDEEPAWSPYERPVDRLRTQRHWGNDEVYVMDADGKRTHVPNEQSLGGIPSRPGRPTARRSPFPPTAAA